MSNNLAALREKQRLSQSKLAASVGVTALTLGRWERGKMLPRPYNIKALCETLQCTEEDLAFPSQVQVLVTPPSPVAPLYDTAIPRTPNELIGRADDQARIKAQLLAHGDGRVTLCALNGLPGVGKTSLAIAIAYDAEIRASFSGGILWAALGPTPNIPTILSRWAGLLGLSEARWSSLSEDQKRQELLVAFGTRSMLLVLDDVWKMSDALALRVGGPNCASLLTTRFPVIASEMAVSDAMCISELNAEQSFHVLRTLAPKVAESAPEQVRALIQVVGGLPLALTLLGHYLHKYSYHAPSRRAVLALEHLSDAQARLQVSTLHIQAKAHPSIASSTPISLQSIIAVSDQWLPSPARKALYTLSIFPAKPQLFTEEAALVVTGCTYDELDLLNDVGLLESYGDLCTLHQVISDYARIHLDETEEHAAYSRLITYIADYVEAHKKDYNLLDLQSPATYLALSQVHAQGKQRELIRIVCAFAPFLILRGFYREAERHLQQANQAARALNDDDALTTTLLYLGEIEQCLGNYTQAETSLQEGLRLACQMNNNERICALLTQLGIVFQQQGNLQQAETAYQEGLRIARNIADHESICTLLYNLGWLSQKQGEFAQSEGYLQEGLALARKINDHEHVGGLRGKPCSGQPSK